MPPIPRVVERCKEVAQRKERLAINIKDMNRVPTELWAKLANGKLNLHNVLTMDKNKEDEVALEFTCDLLTAALICDLFRSEDRKAKRTLTRIYIFRRRVWSKLSQTAVLTLKLPAKRCSFNPEVFSTEEEPIPPAGAVLPL